MSVSHLLVAVSTAALVTCSAYGALAGSTASSASGVGVVSHADQSSGSSVVLGAGSTQEAQSDPGFGSGAGSGAGGGGFAGTLKIKKEKERPRVFTTLIYNENNNEHDDTLTASIAGAHGGAHGYAFAYGKGKDEPGEPGTNVGNPGGGSAEICMVKVKDWEKWRQLTIVVRRAALHCGCPTMGKNQPQKDFCPPHATEIFTAELQ